ncbi:MAG: DUF4271 domain-containing protein [Bacteroidota bacterium]
MPNILDTANLLQKEGVADDAVAIPFKRNDTIKTKSAENSSLFSDSVRWKNVQQEYSHSLIIIKKQAINNKPLEKGQNYSNWLFVFLLISLALFSRLRFYSFRKINLYFKAVFITRAYNQMEREGNILEDRISIPLFIIYLISFSLLVYHSVSHSFLIEIDQSQLPQPLVLFGGIFILILALNLIKSLVNISLSFVFKTSHISRDYRLNTFLIDINLGFIILPFVFVLSFSFSNVLLYLTWAVFTLFTTLRIIKAVIIWLPNSNVFKIFLYFCTVEIAPLFILIKYFISNIDLFK